MRCHFSDGQEANILLIFGHVHCVPPIAVRDEIQSFITMGQQELPFMGIITPLSANVAPTPFK